MTVYEAHDGEQHISCFPPDIYSVSASVRQKIHTFRYAKSIGELANIHGISRAMVRAILGVD